MAAKCNSCCSRAAGDRINYRLSARLPQPGAVDLDVDVGRCGWNDLNRIFGAKAVSVTVSASTLPNEVGGRRWSRP
ncbi:hypothetical protein AMK06_CH01836 [Rhizobium sp. N541]|nr:hypothetical protein AMK05_CH01870 [Rhizobium sp. N324]ANM16745.1 hypothetical protein AMK06_CH01836 [Rhizobium sp. N541]ANM23130.1 hypothetical protein AMK07_CH01833 [Rhizobium sp. N941]OYD03879.1 hypothetical protein AMK08_CH101906 [Rhizobium sp. N4311]